LDVLFPTKKKFGKKFMFFLSGSLLKIKVGAYCEKRNHKWVKLKSY